MKHILFLAFAVIVANCTTTKTTTTTPPTTPAKAPFVTWDKKFIELGKVKKGEKRTIFYEFTNVSKETAQIDIVDACSCTTVDFTRGTLAPGEKGRIDAIFDSKEKNASETIDLTIIFKNQNEFGIPRIEKVSYHFDLEN